MGTTKKISAFYNCSLTWEQHISVISVTKIKIVPKIVLKNYFSSGSCSRKKLFFVPVL